MTKHKVIISGGGTGGHIFPALAIADEIKKRLPDGEILFVGANGKMEMEKVPKAGYNIIGLTIAGLKRGIYFSNLLLPFKLISSLLKARSILKDFDPNLVIGVGGYASAPTLKMAQFMGIPTLIQEQNCYAGKTNKALAKQAKKICVAYEGMDKYFPKTKIVFTGNPVRNSIKLVDQNRVQAIEFFELDKDKKTILIIGGSLGAKSINEAVLQNLDLIRTQKEIQFIWQTGSRYFTEIKEHHLKEFPINLKVFEFIHRMDLAYAISDLVISRAGALSVSELCLLGKAAVLVPSPNVAEDHQTTNAMALVRQNAAILIEDKNAKNDLIKESIKCINDSKLLNQISTNASHLAKPNATNDIVDECLKLIAD